jgi:ferrous iron transport protein B
VIGHAAVAPPLVALVGNPNCGKTALFNLLTGSRQKVANYSGVTVERKEGTLTTPTGRRIRVLDLPGAYSLDPRTLDEQITVDVLLGKQAGEVAPNLVVCVADATNLRQNLRLALSLKRVGVPMVLALNMADLARRRGLDIDVERLEHELGVPVVETVGIRAGGAAALAAAIDRKATELEHHAAARPDPRLSEADFALTSAQVAVDQHEVRRILAAIGADGDEGTTVSDRVDAVVLHPVIGLAILGVTLFLMFQAVFAWAQPPMDAIEAVIAALSSLIGSVLPDGNLKSLLIDGLLAGAGGVLVFLPQILILFFFILLLEDSGYLPRAAFLLDRLMGGVGLSGRSFIPLLSSFACAIPGIMATRTISDPRDRLVTIMVAPLMTCSARLPVYALLIAAFIPQREVLGGLELQGLVLFALYVTGVVAAMAVAFVMKRLGRGESRHTLLLELPSYHWPSLRNLAMGLWQRVQVFLMRVGTIILSLMVIVWFLSTYPAPPPGATEPAITYSIAGYIGRSLEVLFAPIGFNWQICIALVPGLAAREVAVGALGTVYSLSATGDDVAGALGPIISHAWALPTALSLLVWYVFAPMCLSTLAAVKRETAGWKIPLIQTGYLFALAYAASLLTYHAALGMGW